jgi:hypothetical protein
MIFWKIIPVLNSYKKTVKNSKKRFLGPMTRSKLCENGPEIVEKKIHYMRGLPVFCAETMITQKGIFFCGGGGGHKNQFFEYLYEEITLKDLQNNIFLYNLIIVVMAILGSGPR